MSAVDGPGAVAGAVVSVVDRLGALAGAAVSVPLGGVLGSVAGAVDWVGAVAVPGAWVLCASKHAGVINTKASAIEARKFIGELRGGACERWLRSL